MKPALILIVLAVVLPINGQEKGSQSASHKKSAETVKESVPQASPSPSPPVLVNQQRSPIKEDRPKETSKNYLTRLFAPENFPTIGLILVGIWGIRVAKKTLDKIGEQTKAVRDSVGVMQNQYIQTLRQTLMLSQSVKHAGKSADAAKISADALINSERARMVAEFVPMAAKYGNLWHRIEPYGAAVSMSQEEVDAGKHLSYQLKVTNIGRTPAEVFAFHVQWGALNDGKPFSPDTLSNQYQEGVHEFLGQGESRILLLFNVLERFQGVLRDSEKGAVCVTITYGDTVSAQEQREHTTFILYHCPASTSPLERINSQTEYT